MDALLLALLGCLLGEIGDKSQFLVLALATRYDHNGAVITGIIVAAIANSVLSAVAGAWIGPMLGADARLLFLSLAVLFLGFGLIWPVKAPDPLSGWRIGAFLTTMLGVFILSLGDGPQFLIMGIATHSGNPALAAIGGAVGIIIALVPVVLLRDRLLALLPVRVIRAIGAVVLLLTGAIMAVSALALV